MARRRRAPKDALSRKSDKGSHPTREILIGTVVQLLDSRNSEDITVDEVLSESGISSGSLYHHFDDFNHLVEAALVIRVARTVDWSIESLTQEMTSATDAATLAAGLRRVTEAMQAPERAPLRFERVQTVALATINERFRLALAPEQQRLTEAIADLWRDLQERGLFNPNVDPYCGAVFVQAYTLGQILNDVAEMPMPRDSWVELITHIAERSFITPVSQLSA